MSRTLALSLPFFTILILSGCSSKVYVPHKQVMHSFRTQADVSKRFGQADVKRMIDSTEEWIYYHPQVNAPASLDVKTASRDTAQAGNIAQTSRYIQFLFDRHGIVIGYKVSGYDLGYTKKVTAGHNILKVLGVIGLVVLFVSIELYSSTN